MGKCSSLMEENQSPGRHKSIHQPLCPLVGCIALSPSQPSTVAYTLCFHMHSRYTIIFNGPHGKKLSVFFVMGKIVQIN